MNDKFSIGTMTSGEWKGFMNLLAIEEKAGTVFSQEDHGVWCDSEGTEASLVVRKTEDDSVTACMFYTAFEPGVAFFGPLFSEENEIETETHRKLFQEAMEQVELSDSCAQIDVKCVYASENTQNFWDTRGFNIAPKWSLEVVVAQGVQLHHVRKSGWGEEIVLLNVDAIRNSRIYKYDRQVTRGIARSNWIRQWLRHPAGQAKIALNLNGEICGFGIFREVNYGQPRTLCGGPIYANSAEAAKGIIYACLQSFERVEDRNLIMFAPAHDTKLKDLLAEDFHVNVFETTLEMFPMFSGAEKEYSLDKVFSATDPVFSFI